MNASAAELLTHWHEFYILVGTAAAALVALMFVAASVAAGFLGAQRASGRTAGIRTYLSPVIFHFSAALYLSLVALAPGHTRASLVILVAGVSVIGTVYGAIVLVQIMRHHAADWPDRLCYGLIPFLSYLVGIAAAAFVSRGSEVGAELMAATAVALLLVNIRNAWDLMLSLARRNPETSRTSGDLDAP